jgi:hypothetical protein
MTYFIKVTETPSGLDHIASLKSRIIDAKSGIKILSDCPKCSGKGGISHFAHVQLGICFLCKGSKQTYSYRTDAQKYKNRALKDEIAILENGLYVTKELINEFCNIEEHQTPFFRKFSNWFYKKATEQGLRGYYIISDLPYMINCHPKFMYE